jgi:hypothetical protein
MSFSTQNEMKSFLIPVVNSLMLESFLMQAVSFWIVSF